MEKTTQKRTLKGIIVSDKMTKTRVVAVSRLQKHKKYHKYHNMTKKYKAHDEKEEYAVGDTVMIEETRPISKDKRWKIVKLVKKATLKEKEEKEA